MRDEEAIQGSILRINRESEREKVRERQEKKRDTERDKESDIYMVFKG